MHTQTTRGRVDKASERGVDDSRVGVRGAWRWKQPEPTESRTNANMNTKTCERVIVGGRTTQTTRVRVKL